MDQLRSEIDELKTTRTLGRETEVLEKAKNMIKLKSDDINAFTFIPYQGTSLRTMCEEKKYLDKKTLANIYETDSLLDMPSISKKEIGGLVKTFPLYTRLPRSYWKDIKIAELDTPEGKKVYDNLLGIFRDQYYSAALARD